MLGSLISGAVSLFTGDKAEDAQHAAQYRQIREQEEARKEAREILDPFVQAGERALGGIKQYEDLGAEGLGTLRSYTAAGVPALEEQQALMGLRGAEEQQRAIDAVREGSEYGTYMDEARQQLLKAASATGGLRGGATQQNIARLAPNLLGSLIDRRINRLGQTAQMGGNIAQNLLSTGERATTNLLQSGQSAAAGTATAGLRTGENLANIYGDMGRTQAAYQMGVGNTINRTMDNVYKDIGSAMGLGGF